MTVLPDAYRITRGDLEAALAAQKWPCDPAHRADSCGKITLDAARVAVDGNKAMIVGGDSESELYRYGRRLDRSGAQLPSHAARGCYYPVDTSGTRAGSVYDSHHRRISASRGASGVQFRPLAFPLRPDR